MTDRPKTGKRVQVYIPADLVERWDSTPRYERSATVAAALRLFWEPVVTPAVTPGADQPPLDTDAGQQNAQ